METQRPASTPNHPETSDIPGNFLPQMSLSIIVKLLLWHCPGTVCGCGTTKLPCFHATPELTTTVG